MEEVMRAMAHYMEAKTNHDKAREQCEYDWGYFGHYEIKRLEEAEKELSKAMNDYIDRRIDEKLGLTSQD